MFMLSNWQHLDQNGYIMWAEMWALWAKTWANF